MSNQDCSNQLCKCDPCKCKDCKCTDVEFFDKDVAIKGNLFVKEDACVAGDLNVKGRITSSSTGGAELLPPIVNGQAVFRVGAPAINGELGIFFVPSGFEDEVITIVFDSSFVLAHLGRRLTFILAPSRSGDTFRGIFIITSPYLDAAGNATIRTFQITRNNPFLVDVIFALTAQGPIVIVSEIGAIANPAIANPILAIPSFGGPF